MKFDKYKSYEGRLVDLYDSLADDEYGSYANGNILAVYDDDDKMIASFDIEFIGADGSDLVKVTGIEIF
ncbi:MAG: hypothetical protein PWP16_447 [Eubacteriaceae bacterium]|jgi:hypothetical protein|nr:hypothetical protein [Eubacteriaceae bacterium]